MSGASVDTRARAIVTCRAFGTVTKVLVGRGLLAEIPSLLEAPLTARALIVADVFTAPLYADPLARSFTAAGREAHVFTTPAGEEAKTLAGLESLYTACAAHEVEREDVVVALGGGVVGDVAGMLAATYLRGLPLVQVPTSLVAMVSASLGGKAGLNFGAAKNRIGAFKPADRVIVDLDALATLPDVERRSGLGELLAVGVLGAPTVFEALEADPEAPLDPLVAAALRAKAEIVEADPEDRTGIRARLNLGHTFGHAFEALSGFTLPHGLAVAAGLLVASRLASGLGLCAASLPERIAAVLARLELAVPLEGFGVSAVIDAMRSDKKRKAGRLRFVLPRDLGDVVLVGEDEVPEALLRRTLGEVLQEAR